jgi:uncharacterized membrane protein
MLTKFKADYNKVLEWNEKKNLHFNLQQKSSNILAKIKADYNKKKTCVCGNYKCGQNLRVNLQKINSYFKKHHNQIQKKVIAAIISMDVK